MPDKNSVNTVVCGLTETHFSVISSTQHAEHEWLSHTRRRSSIRPEMRAVQAGHSLEHRLVTVLLRTHVRIQRT